MATIRKTGILPSKPFITSGATRKVRETVARSYDIGVAEPVIQVTDADLRGDRTLCLEHNVRDRIPLSEMSRDEVLKHVRRLWGYEICLKGIDQESGDTIYESKVALG